MLKFIKHHMETMLGIELYPLVSFVIFFLFFVLVTWYVYGRDKGYFARIGQLPLEGDEPINTNLPNL